MHATRIRANEDTGKPEAIIDVFDPRDETCRHAVTRGKRIDKCGKPAVTVRFIRYRDRSVIAFQCAEHGQEA